MDLGDTNFNLELTPHVEEIGRNHTEGISRTVAIIRN